MSALIGSNLIETPFTWVQAQQFRKNAHDLLNDAGRQFLGAGSKFLLAYESLHALCVGFLYVHGLAPSKGPGHRQVVLQLALHELGLPAVEVIEVSEAHIRRNELTYRSPAPPVSMQVANDLHQIAGHAMQMAKAKLPAWFVD